MTKNDMKKDYIFSNAKLPIGLVISLAGIVAGMLIRKNKKNCIKQINAKIPLREVLLVTQRHVVKSMA